MVGDTEAYVAQLLAYVKDTRRTGGLKGWTKVSSLWVRKNRRDSPRRNKEGNDIVTRWGGRNIRQN